MYHLAPVNLEHDSGNKPTTERSLSMASSSPVHRDGCLKVSHLKNTQINLPYMVSHHNVNKTHSPFHGPQSPLNLDYPLPQVLHSATLALRLLQEHTENSLSWGLPKNCSRSQESSQQTFTWLVPLLHSGLCSMSPLREAFLASPV